MTIPLSDFLLSLSVAGGLGALIGMERQWHQGLSSLRTNVLVAIAAAAFVALPGVLGEAGTGPAHSSTFVMTGLGFLGGGVIFREGNSVRGINTAATLWGTGAVGAFSGAGLSVHALCITAAILCANLVMRPAVSLVNRLMRTCGAGTPTAYLVEVDCTAAVQEDVRLALSHGFNGGRVGVHSLSATEGQDGQVSFRADVMAYRGRQADISGLVAELWRNPGVSMARWSLAAVDADPGMHTGN